MELSFVQAPVTGILDGLRAGNYDAICSPLPEKQYKAEDLAASIPFTAYRQVLVLHGKKKIFASDDWTGMRFGARKESRGLEAIAAISGVSAQPYDTVEQAMEDLFIEALDGVVCEEPVALYFVKTRYRGRLKMAGYMAQDPKRPVRVIMLRGNIEKLEALNRGLEAIKARRIDKELEKKWFSRR
ncbi:MAG: hypothetical protein Kow0089_11420 [Desulfobulbaceae bacterium]